MLCYVRIRWNRSTVVTNNEKKSVTLCVLERCEVHSLEEMSAKFLNNKGVHDNSVRMHSTHSKQNLPLYHNSTF